MCLCNSLHTHRNKCWLVVWLWCIGHTGVCPRGPQDHIRSGSTFVNIATHLEKWFWHQTFVVRAISLHCWKWRHWKLCVINLVKTNIFTVSWVQIWKGEKDLCKRQDHFCILKHIPLSMLELRWQFFLVSAPILLSFSSMRMHISASNCTCFSSRWSVVISGILSADCRCLASLRCTDRSTAGSC